MYCINEIFYLDDEYSKRADFCNNNNLMIVEIDPDEKGRRFQIQNVPSPTTKEMYLLEMNNLKNWFENVYSYKEQKFRRLRTLGYKCDDYSDPYDALIELYNEAEIKRKRIQELETFIEIEENKQKGGNIDA